ncbi:MAG TPA: hypothetical protein VKA46_21430 [Gemmataceae bacterium]|nr:hypothetical protein [Gemmataceae bacterium]
MKPDQFAKLLVFLDRLDKQKIHYRLSKHLEEALSVEVYAPGEHWEVDFWADGEVYVERFRSNGHIDDEAVLSELFALCSDEEPSSKVGSEPR